MAKQDDHWTESQRAGIQLQMWERIEQLDDEELDQLNAWLDTSGQGPPKARRGLTRRELLMGGGVALLGFGTGISSRALTSPRPAPPRPEVAAPAIPPGTPFPDMRDRVAELEAQSNALSGALDENNRLLDLYRQLEEIALDDTVRGGIALLLLFVAQIASAAASLRTGLVTAKLLISELDQAFVGLDSGLAGVERAVTGVSGAVQALEDGLRAAGEPVRPLTDALGSFFKGLISRIPRVGDDILAAIERVEAVIGAVPELIEGVNGQLIRPMRERFFPRDGDNVRVRLLDPLVELIFLPADTLLGKVAELETTVTDALAAPADAKMAQRDEIRVRIEKLQSGE